MIFYDEIGSTRSGPGIVEGDEVDEAKLFRNPRISESVSQESRQETLSLESMRNRLMEMTPCPRY